jgi:hypothetical protein
MTENELFWTFAAFRMRQREHRRYKLPIFILNETDELTMLFALALISGGGRRKLEGAFPSISGSAVNILKRNKGLGMARAFNARMVQHRRIDRGVWLGASDRNRRQLPSRVSSRRPNRGTGRTPLAREAPVRKTGLQWSTLEFGRASFCGRTCLPRVGRRKSSSFTQLIPTGVSDGHSRQRDVVA